MTEETVFKFPNKWTSGISSCAVECFLHKNSGYQNLPLRHLDGLKYRLCKFFIDRKGDEKSFDIGLYHSPVIMKQLYTKFTTSIFFADVIIAIKTSILGTMITHELCQCRERKTTLLCSF